MSLVAAPSPSPPSWPSTKTACRIRSTGERRAPAGRPEHQACVDRQLIAPPDPAGARLGPLWLSPGVTRGNAATLLFGAFSTLSLVTFVTFAQPYLFAILGIPRTGRVRSPVCSSACRREPRC